MTVGRVRAFIWQGCDYWHAETAESLEYCPYGAGRDGAVPFRDIWDRERFELEQEYDRIFTGFGFAKEDKEKFLSDFSGGEQTKIAPEKPDILLFG